jgi:ketosteroid isomerase-like protein
MEPTGVQRWVDAYVRAWSTNDPADIGVLFTDDASHYTAPFREPWRGRQGIVKGWLHRKDDPGGWEFRYEVQAVAGDLGFVRGLTHYREPPLDYSNLWVIRLDPDGRCSEFTEWWMEHKRPHPG